MLENRSILITGGTGSLGRALIKHILKKYPGTGRIVIFSRDEGKQSQMAQTYPAEKFPQLKYCIGDVRDKERMKLVLKGIDFVIHAAAMKYVPIAELNPDECVKTNITGAQNIINACLENDVKRVVSLSTDKAAAPNNLYGATKLASDKLFVAANNSAEYSTKFSVVRYGNIMGSTGSVIPFFLERKKHASTLPITDLNMTRFNISIEEGVNMVMFALENAWGGEIFVPKISSYRITDLAEAIWPGCEIEVMGIRPGEKIHEDMITESDSINTYDINKYYAILPSNHNWNLQDFIKHFNGKKVDPGFRYNSGKNDKWESVDSLRHLIKVHVDPTFKV